MKRGTHAPPKHVMGLDTSVAWESLAAVQKLNTTTDKKVVQLGGHGRGQASPLPETSRSRARARPVIALVRPPPFPEALHQQPSRDHLDVVDIHRGKAASEVLRAMGGHAASQPRRGVDGVNEWG